MELLREFIEVTSVFDGKRSAIRAACIESIEENAEQRNGDIITRPECVTIYYAGHSLDVSESYDDVIAMTYKAEM